MKGIILIALCAVALTQATLTRSSPTWNLLLNAKGIFPGDHDAISTRSAGSSAILNELEALLAQPYVLHGIYSNFMERFGKSIVSAKDVSRTRIFKENLMKIASHNLEAEAGKHSWIKAVNQFADMTEQEFLQLYTGYKVDLSSALKNSSMPQTQPKVFSSRAAANIDWRAYGAVSSVKNQGSCGSCVPFAAAACLESSHAIWHNNQMFDLSEQELIDCSRGNGNAGCAGGTFVPTFDYLRNNGLSNEGDYRYEMQDGSCRSGGKSHPARPTGWWPVEPHGNEGALTEAISSFGPIAVAIHANGDFQAYGGGIFEAPCQGGRNHAVLAIGYGNENGRDFFIVKNSWDTWWGEGGFMRIRRNYGNMCDISSDAVLINA